MGYFLENWLYGRFQPLRIKIVVQKKKKKAQIMSRCRSFAKIVYILSYSLRFFLV